MKTVIGAGGEFQPSSPISEVVETAELLIAADGGGAHLEACRRLPHYLIGDLDSIDPTLLTRYRREQVEIRQYPAAKDATDLELCLDLALERGSTDVTVIGGLGGRWDMSFGNVLLAAAEKYRDMAIGFLTATTALHILRPGEHRLETVPKRSLSFIPLRTDVEGLCLAGVEYPLDNHTVPFGSSLCLSNRATAAGVNIRFRAGILLAVLSLEDQEAPAPFRPSI